MKSSSAGFSGSLGRAGLSPIIITVPGPSCFRISRSPTHSKSVGFAIGCASTSLRGLSLGFASADMAFLAFQNDIGKVFARLLDRVHGEPSRRSRNRASDPASGEAAGAWSALGAACGAGIAQEARGAARAFGH